MMTQDQRDQIGLTLTEISLIYGEDFPKQKAIVFINTLEKYSPASFEQYQAAIEKYVFDKKNRKFPTIFSLREIIYPEASDESNSNEVASRIRYAVSKFGHCNRNEAMEYIGELGKLIVDRMGGWQYICENLGLMLNPATFHAQCRDAAKAIQEQAKLGILDRPIGIPLQSQPAQLNKAQNLILELANKKSLQEG